MQNQYDCLVIGAGPAGCTAAALVSEAGFTTALVEREKLPRFHVGESLMPETYWTLERLGVLDRMKTCGFTEKHSVQFVTNKGHESDPFYFQDHDDRDCSKTWQVERAEFDKMLFDNAADKGADCFDETRVLDVTFEGDRANGVKLQLADGQRCEVSTRVIIDATGQQALIANKLGLRETIPELKKAAIWSYFKDAERLPGRDGGATVILHTKTKEAWFWYIPLKDNITSVGLVGDIDFVLKSRPSPGDAFCEELGNCEALARRLKPAEMVGDFRVAKEFSYTTQKHAGDGWVLVGDAFGFIDPIYSSGVFFALKTGELAADAVVEGLQANDLSATRLSSWADDFKTGARWIRELVDVYYDNDFSFGDFLRNHPEHRSNLTDLLIGRVFHEGAGEMFKDM